MRDWLQRPGALFAQMQGQHCRIHHLLQSLRQNPNPADPVLPKPPPPAPRGFAAPNAGALRCRVPGGALLKPPRLYSRQTFVNSLRLHLGFRVWISGFSFAHTHTHTTHTHTHTYTTHANIHTRKHTHTQTHTRVHCCASDDTRTSSKLRRTKIINILRKCPTSTYVCVCIYMYKCTCVYTQHSPKAAPALGEDPNAAVKDAGPVLPKHRRRLQRVRGAECKHRSEGCWTRGEATLNGRALQEGQLRRKAPRQKALPG